MFMPGFSFECDDVHVQKQLLFSPGGHGGGPTAKRPPEPELLRSAGHLPADRRRKRPEPAGFAESGGARVPDALFTRHQLDLAVHRLQSPRGKYFPNFNDISWAERGGNCHI